jgi:alanine racemase
MDQIVVEAKKIDKVNDNNVIIFGNGKNCPQTIDDIAKIGNSPPYEILCRVGYRINRIYK